MLIIKLYSVLVNPLDYSDLQNNPNDLQQWSDRWQLNISYKKCNVLYLGKQRIRPRVNLVLGNSHKTRSRQCQRFTGSQLTVD